MSEDKTYTHEAEATDNLGYTLKDLEAMAHRSKAQQEARARLAQNRAEINQKLAKELGRETIHIIRPRRSKKTAALIRLAASIDRMGGCAYIVTANKATASYTADLARSIGVNLRNPITFSSWLKGGPSSHITHFLFDDVDLMLKQRSGSATPIALTMSRPARVMRRSIRVDAVTVETGDEISIDVSVILRGERVEGHVPDGFEEHIVHADGPILSRHVLVIRNGINKDAVHWMLIDDADIDGHEHEIWQFGISAGICLTTAAVGKIIGYATGVIDGSMQWSDLT